jgi:ubiquinone/menaquinone biosynthesis C-methylase UbiE
VKVDWSNTAADYRRHRAGFPDRLFDELTARGIGLTGHRLLDLGTGTGALARGFALRGAEVTGVDLSMEMMEQAREIDAACGAEVAYRRAPAEHTGLETGHFDVVTAGQCWHWFKGAAAMTEARRVLKPGGALVICHFDWLPLAGNVVEATENLVELFNGLWTMGGGAGVYPEWFRQMGRANFEEIESFTFDAVVDYSHEDWRGRMRASAPISGALTPTEVAVFDEALSELLRESFPTEPLRVPHRAFAVIGKSPARLAKA